MTDFFVTNHCSSLLVFRLASFTLTNWQLVQAVTPPLLSPMTLKAEEPVEDNAWMEKNTFGVFNSDLWENKEWEKKIALH